MASARNEVHYVGLFDDKVNDYPWQKPITLDYFNEVLIKQSLLGKPMAINDGYLLNYEAGRTALVDDTKSPLRELINSGFIVMLSRNEGKLHEMHNGIIVKDSGGV